MVEFDTIRYIATGETRYILLIQYLITWMMYLSYTAWTKKEYWNIGEVFQYWGFKKWSRFLCRPTVNIHFHFNSQNCLNLLLSIIFSFMNLTQTYSCHYHFPLTRWEELCARVVEGNVSDSLTVAVVSPHTPSVFVNFPQLKGSISYFICSL